MKWRKLEAAFAVVIALFGAAAYILASISADNEGQQWAMILLIGGYVLLLAEREVRGSKILGPNEDEKAWETITRIFSNGSTFVKVIDPYCDERTLAALSMTSRDVPAYLLTSSQMSKKNVKGLEEAIHELKNEREEFEARYAPRGYLHGRYILTKPFGWSIDHSIKDAGRKETRISSLGIDETKKMVERFDEYWDKSETI
jgi:hypothetical protein